MLFARVISVALGFKVMDARSTLGFKVMDARSKRAREVQAEINRILFEIWDPIGMKDALPPDEYNAYVGPVYRALSNGANEAEIISVLTRLESHIGCRAQWPDKRKAAARLCAVNLSIK